MTQPQRTPDDINAAINTAARRMTSGAPSTDLRARVLSRIDVPQPRWGWWLAVAGGAIASVAVLVATQLVSPKPEPAMVAIAPPMATELVSPRPEDGGLVSPKPKAKAHPTAVANASSPVLSTASVTHTATRRVIVEVSAAELEWRARGVQALAGPDALHVTPLEHPLLTIEPIDITPLSVAPLTVLSQSGGSNK